MCDFLPINFSFFFFYQCFSLQKCSLISYLFAHQFSFSPINRYVSVFPIIFPVNLLPVRLHLLIFSLFPLVLSQRSVSQTYFLGDILTHLVVCFPRDLGWFPLVVSGTGGRHGAGPLPGGLAVDLLPDIVLLFFLYPRLQKSHSPRYVKLPEYAQNILGPQVPVTQSGDIFD